MAANENGALPQAQTPIRRHTRQFASLRCVMALMIREMATRYGRSVGGYVWAFLEPLAGILILSLGFSLLVRNPPLGNSFIVFYATGILPFGLYQKLSSLIGRAINFSRSLLFYPAITWLDAILARLLLTSITEILVMIILMTTLLQITDTRIVLEFSPILQSIALAILVGIGIGILNCAIFGLFPVWMQIWDIATRPMLLISGVIFLYDDLGPFAQNILWYNPLMHITGLMRRGFYPHYQGEYVNVTYVITVGLVSMFLGLLLMRRHHRDIIHNR